MSTVRSSFPISELGEDLVVLGEAVRFVFAVDVRPVNFDVEDASSAFDQFRPGARASFDCVRQTGGLWEIVSLNAIGDRNLHARSFLSEV